MDGSYRVSVARYHEVEMIDVEVTKHVDPPFGRTDVRRNHRVAEELLCPDEPTERGDSSMRKREGPNRCGMLDLQIWKRWPEEMCARRGKYPEPASRVTAVSRSIPRTDLGERPKLVTGRLCKLW